MHQGGRRHSGNEWNGLDAAAAGLDRLPSHNPVNGPISTFDENIRLEGCDEGAGVRFRKGHHIVYAGQCSQNLGSLGIGHNGTIGAFVQGAHGLVGIHADHQHITQIASRLQVADMADVHQVEAAVCEDDALSLPTALFQS